MAPVGVSEELDELWDEDTELLLELWELLEWLLDTELEELE